MNYIKRTLENKVLEASEDYACLLLIGPRQVGKSTMLEHLMQGTPRRKVTLDNAEERKLAKNDPEIFLTLHPAPLLIDEVQYAPNCSHISKYAATPAHLLAHTGLLVPKHFR